MIPHLFYYQLVVLGLLRLCVMLHAVWPSRGAGSHPRPAEAELIKPKRQRSNEPQPFAGLTHQPPCALCEHEAAHPQAPPPVPPEPMPPTHRRPRTLDTSRHFCPHAGCRYRGWLGWGNLRANGHPNGGPWRQFQCTSCSGYFPEHHGTIFVRDHRVATRGRLSSECLASRTLRAFSSGLALLSPLYTGH